MKMEIAITAEMVENLKQRNDEVRGTCDFGKYECECRSISASGKSWNFTGWAVPIYTGGYTAKKYNGNWYAYSPMNDQRYRLCREVCRIWELY